MKKALLIVSFGTSHRDAEDSCIRPVEQALAEAFPDRTPYRAWSSRFIVKKILRTRGEVVETEDDAVERLRSEGYEDILVVPTHIIPGGEYDLAAAAAAGHRISRPLLDDDDDLVWMAGLLGSIADEEGRTLLMMGHGTEHAADQTYYRLRERLPGNVITACVEGGLSLESVLPDLEALEKKEVTLMPLMLVAGDHAKNDMAGDEDDSWKTRLQAMGFDVRVRLQGLGALPQVRERFIAKARRAENEAKD